MTQDTPKIEQRHRDAALGVAEQPFGFRTINGQTYSDRYFINRGQADDHPLVQAFARFERDHMPQPTPAQAESAGEGLSAAYAWQDLVEKDDRTSPDEYPDMALITFDELADYMQATRLTSPTAPFDVSDDAQIATARAGQAWSACEGSQEDADMAAARVIQEYGDRRVAEAIAAIYPASSGNEGEATCVALVSGWQSDWQNSRTGKHHDDGTAWATAFDIAARLDQELSRAQPSQSEEVTAHRCAAINQGSAGGNDPADCDWPFCGCDPSAQKVLDAVTESQPPYPGLPMSDADLDKHYAASKVDVIELVGSEVRQIIGEIKHYRRLASKKGEGR